MFNDYQILSDELEKLLPFEASPSRELVQALKNKNISLKSVFIVEHVYNSDDIGGIICAIPVNDEVVACGLTHLIVPVSNPLYKKIYDYQVKRIKRLKKLNR